MAATLRTRLAACKPGLLNNVTPNTARRYRNVDGPTLGFVAVVEDKFPVVAPLLRVYTDHRFDASFPPQQFAGAPEAQQRQQQAELCAALLPAAPNVAQMLQRGRLYRLGSHPGTQREIDIASISDAAWVLAHDGPPAKPCLFDALALDTGLLGAHGQQQELARWQSVDQSTDLTGAVYITTAGDCKVVCTGPIGDRTVTLVRTGNGPAYVYIGATENFAQRDRAALKHLPAGLQWRRYYGNGASRSKGRRVMVVTHGMGGRVPGQPLSLDELYRISVVEVFLIAAMRAIYGYNPRYCGKGFAAVRNVIPLGIYMYKTLDHSELVGAEVDSMAARRVRCFMRKSIRGGAATLHPNCGRAVMFGGAPPFGAARHWAAGQGAHRLVQGFDGGVFDISWLRLAPINAQGMQAVFNGQFNVGQFGNLFANEYPDDHCDPESAVPTVLSPLDDRPNGGSDDCELWAVYRLMRIV